MIRYRLLLALLSPLILTHLFWKALRSRSLTYLTQRLAINIRTLKQEPLWFHCASVGETRMILPLINALHEEDPDLHFIITSNTDTSRKIVLDQRKLHIQHLYLPLDFMFAVDRFLSIIRPRVLFLVETELWPNLIMRTSDKGIGIHMLNARLSPKTLRAKGFLRSIYRRLLGRIDHIHARTHDDCDHFIALGASADQVTAVGNLKYAFCEQDQYPQDMTKRDYVIAASTHEDEEIEIVRRWMTMGRKELLVIAPRHPGRSDAIIRQLRSLAHHIVTRTSNQPITDETEIFVLDTIGEMASWFVSARLVIMGGSFVDIGGHNVIEAAQAGSAMIYGPSMYNFEEENRLLLDNKAAIQVEGYDELGSMLRVLLDNEATRAQLSADALAAVEPFKTILEDYLRIIRPILRIS